MHFRRLLPLLAALPGAILTAQEAAPAAPAPAAAVEVSLEQCLTRALAHGFDVEIARYNPAIARDAIEIAKDPYTPTLTASSSHSHTQSDASGAIPGTSTDASNTSVSVAQQLYSGTTVTVSSQLNRSRLNPTLSALNPAYDADLTVAVRQQLLKGFGSDVNRAGVRAAELGYDAAQLTYKASILNIIQNTENAYYALVFAREQLAVHEATLSLAQVLYNEAVTRKNTGVATELDVFTADVAVQSARRQVLLDQKTLRDNQDQLLAIVGRFEFDAPILPQKLGEATEGVPVYASAFAQAKQNQPDYLAAAAGVEQAKVSLVAAKNGTKPSLSVGGAVGLNATRGSASDAYSDALSDRGNTWQLDVALTYPWGQPGDKARYRQSLAALNQAQARLQQLEQSVAVQVRSAVRAVETNVESVKISARGTELAVRQYELQKAKFDAGLATSREVLQSQTDLETARLNELQARVSLWNSYTALHRIEGSSLQRYHLDVP